MLCRNIDEVYYVNGKRIKIKTNEERNLHCDYNYVVNVVQKTVNSFAKLKIMLKCWDYK